MFHFPFNFMGPSSVLRSAVEESEENLFADSDVAETMQNVADHPFITTFFGDDFLTMMLRLVITLVTTGIVIHCFYYPRSRRRDYYFAFAIIALSIFFLVMLLGSIKLKIGFALGIFAIFGIIRYRTEAMPIREMTYLFAITAISVINALVNEFGFILVADVIFIAAFGILESTHLLRHVSCKIIKYDRIELIHTDRYDDLIADLKSRTGLPITKVEVGAVDFLKDAAILKVYYEQGSKQINSVDGMTKMPKAEEL